MQLTPTTRLLKAVGGKVRIRTANLPFFFFRLRNRQKLVRIRSRIYGIRITVYSTIILPVGVKLGR